MKLHQHIPAPALTALVAVLTGCSGTDLPDTGGNERVEFDCTPRLIPGEVTDTYTIPDFRVSAFRNDQWGAVVLMDNVVVTRTGINSWVYSPPVNWPEDQSVDFFAVSPASQTITNNQWWHHTFKYDNAGADTDLLVSVKLGVMQTSGRIKLNFRHALAKVQIRLKCSDTDCNVSVAEVELCNLSQYGEFYYPSATTSPETNQGELFDCWHTYGAHEDIVVFRPADGDAVDLSTEPVTVGPQNMFLIPDSLSVFNHGAIWEGTHVYVRYSIDGNLSEARIPLREATPGFRWLPGRNYRYTLDLKPATRADTHDSAHTAATCDMF